MKIVYLAGGRSGWRSEILEKLGKDFIFINPMEKEIMGVWSVDEYGKWDKEAIIRSDIIFAYMEKDNPSGFGLSCEIGFADGIGKFVILVLEKNHAIHKDKYLEFMTVFSDAVFQDLNSGLEYLKTQI